MKRKMTEEAEASWLNVESLLCPEWKEVLETELVSEEFEALKKRLDTCSKRLYPPRENVWHAYNQCLPSKIKVVIVAQDPFIKPGQANGLCFSSLIDIPPSTQNIFVEVAKDYPEFKQPLLTANLEKWASQGVLLLNTVLTVQAGRPQSCKGWGWEQVTMATIKHIAKQKRSVVFMLWGQDAKTIGRKARLDSFRQHCVLRAGHPSPLSVKYFVDKHHFKKANDFLRKRGQEPIDWTRF